MSGILFRTPSHSSLATSSRLWIPRKCLHTSSPAQKSVLSSTKANDKPSLVKALNLTAAETRKVAKKRGKRVEYKPTENLVKKHLVQLRDNPFTVQDVEHLKPKKQTNAKSKNYESEYQQVLNVLLKSFTWPQLRQYVEHANLSPPSRGNKLATAQHILENIWGWTPLQQVLQDRADWSESGEQLFTLDPGYSFLLVGKDGTELLQLSRRYNVKMSFTNPRTLKVQGLKGALKQVAGYIESFRNDVTTEDFDLPTKKKLTVLADRISRVSGAHVKPKDDAKIALTFLRSHPQTAYIAKRLILQAITSESSSTRIVYNGQPESSEKVASERYSLYPFLPPQPLSWQNPSSSFFRYRRVGEWLKSPQFDKPETQLGTSAGSRGIESLENEFGNSVESQLLLQLGESGSGSPNFIVSTGHLLIVSPPNQRTTLTPPLIGHVDSGVLLDWINHSRNRVIFHPSAPTPTLSTPTKEEYTIRRIVYRSMTSAQNDASHDNLKPGPTTTLTFELPCVEQNSETSTSASEFASEAAADNLNRVSLLKGVESSVEIFVPDGSSDLMISASRSQVVPNSSWPEEWKNAAVSLLTSERKLQNDTSFPLVITHDGEQFFFAGDWHVHRSLKTVMLEGMEDEQTIIVETTTDHDTGKSVTMCKANCEDYKSQSQWNNFLRICGSLSNPLQKCDTKVHSIEEFSPF
ncbi:hypothetical protein JR316_0000887 [Psilocybe cubensis]|uniref:Uncharacterized protein n=1 Tax=Psilocybe cubensis TaxID=181762 RepID=A0ACB8HGN2_PSICU|nr:hypothetical protein JR316_0000887 [Psilocybe cubensis]KAH9486822.1 hypothetical protein JR316_0000887 [Psilocybe cubensis]